MANEVERPDEHEAGAAGEGYCWMPSNMNRECGADCVAFDKRHVHDPKISSCTLLNTFRSIGLSLVKLTSPQAAPLPSPPTIPPPGVK